MMQHAESRDTLFGRACRIGLFIAFLAHPMPGFAQALSAPQIIASIQRAYRVAGNIKGKLKQTYHSALYDRSRVQWGYLYSKYPDKFLIKYVKPERTQFVGDGQQVWMWQQEDNQAARITNPRAVQGVQILLGSASIDKDFTVSLDPPSNGIAYHLRLTPKQSTPQYDRIVLGVRHDFIIVEATLVKKTDSNRLDLSEIVLSSHVPDSLFVFRPPPGTRILHAPQATPPVPTAIPKAGAKPKTP